MKTLIKEINKIELKKDELLVVELPISTSLAALDAFRRQFKEFTIDIFKEGKIMIVRGDLKFTKIKDKGNDKGVI